MTNGHCVTVGFPNADGSAWPSDSTAQRSHPVALGQEQADGIWGRSARKQLEARIKEQGLHSPDTLSRWPRQMRAAVPLA